MGYNSHLKVRPYRNVSGNLHIGDGIYLVREGGYDEDYLIPKNKSEVKVYFRSYDNKGKHGVYLLKATLPNENINRRSVDFRWEGEGKLYLIKRPMNQFTDIENFVYEEGKLIISNLNCRSL